MCAATRIAKYRVCGVLAAVVAGVTVLPPAAGAVTYRTVALSGQQAPGLEPGVVLVPYLFPSINKAGRVTFQAGLSGAGVDENNNAGVWVERNGAIALVARAGDQVPGADAGVVYDRFPATSRTINDAGGVSFKSLITGVGVDDTNNTVYVAESSGVMQQVARTGDPAPGTAPGVVFSSIGNKFEIAVFNAAGQSIIGGSLAGTGVDDTNNRGLWSDASGTLSLVARTGDQAPGTDIGTLYASFDTAPVLNNTGQTAFRATLTGPNVDATNNEGLWTGPTDDLQLTLRAGGPAPGTDPGVIFSDSALTAGAAVFSLPTINSSGQIAFTGGLAGTGITDGNSQGLWAGPVDALQLVARAGDTAPGIDGPFLRINQPAFNDNGRVAFQAIIPADAVGAGGTFARGIWSDASGQLEAIAIQGDQAPGVEEGSVFNDFNGAFGPEMNASGQVAFRARLTSPNNEIHNTYGIWATDVNGELQLIARQGDLFDVNDYPLIEDLRTISFIDMLFTGYGGGVNGTPASFNDNGQLAFYMSFTDGSRGAFVASTRLHGDLNGDGFVGIADLNIVLGAWNQTVTPGNANGDPSGDGYVGIADLTTVLGNWNTGTPPGGNGAAIPEPGALLMMGFGGLCVGLHGPGRAQRH